MVFLIDMMTLSVINQEKKLLVQIGRRPFLFGIVLPGEVVPDAVPSFPASVVVIHFCDCVNNILITTN